VTAGTGFGLEFLDVLQVMNFVGQRNSKAIEQSGREKRKTHARRSALDLLKRAADIVITLLLVAVFAPFFLLVTLLVRLKLGSPVLFRQDRPGLGGKRFQMVKFRTMTNARGADGELLPDAQRLTGFGRMLRATSLDELPELWNVLKGDMSLVGPRPLLMEYLPLYTPEQSRRHEVRPGITGWAQVNGRNAISWEEKLKLDVWYVDNRSFWLDLKIIAKTVWCIFNKSGITAPGEATMSKFTGSAQ
jgi:lipopolysaccharide/colanic/teichoic acid biosynthesis glycosyltransferase